MFASALLPPVFLRLPARPESVAVARHEAAALGARLGLDSRRTDDLKTLVSEACANVVTHAYAAKDDGSFEIDVVPGEDELTITVTDDGEGIRPRPASEGSSGRPGLLLIAALASRMEIARRPEGGTRIEARFPLS